MKCYLALFLTVLAVAFSAAFASEPLERFLAVPPVVPPQPIDGWTAFGGDWCVANGANGSATVTASASDGPKLVYADDAWRNISAGEVAIEIRCGDAPADGYSNAGILISVSEAGVGADNFIGYEVAISSKYQHVNVGRHRFNYEPLLQVPFTFSPREWNRLHVRFDSGTIEVSVNDKVVATHRDTSPQAIKSGGVALRSWQQSAEYRNVRIRKSSNDSWSDITPREPNATVPVADLEVASLPPILFVSRHHLTQPNSVGNDIWMARPTAFGCAIRIIEPAKPKLAARTIWEDPRGSIYDMNLSRDGKTIFFSHCTDDDPYWHLWRIGVDGTELKQLTSGDFYDVSPCETPVGDIVFVSTRRGGYTVCQPGPASNLHRLARQSDGSFRVECVSMNTLSDMSPQMLPDGRVLFTRWEYIDRDLTYRQSLWTQNPDGSSYQLFFGNTIRDVGTFWQARPLPGETNIVVATFAPHHGFPHGMIGLIDRSFGVEGEKGKGFVYITQETPSVADQNQPWRYRDPFPLSHKTFLCSDGSAPTTFPNAKRRFAIVLLNRSGAKRLLYEERDRSCVFPIPLHTTARNVAERSEGIDDVDVSVVNAESSLPSLRSAIATLRFGLLRGGDEDGEDDEVGTLLLSNVNEGLQGRVTPGTIVALRVMEQVRKTEDLVNRAYDQSPVMSYATYYAKRDWGTVLLESDGSAHFVVPALREIYLQALDADGREVQRMTSALQVMPGERVSCVGCHESRDAAAVVPSRFPIAATKPAVVPKISDWLVSRKRVNEFPDAQILDYPSIVQPVLDKYCVECHRGERADGGYDLTGDATRFFSMSYDNLLGTSRSYRQHNMATGEMLPEEAARGKPLVHFFWLLWTPTAVNLPYITGSHASRLTELLDSDHAGVTIPREDRERVALWIDANAPYYSTYAHARSSAPGRRDRFADPVSGAASPWFAEKFLDVYKRRCAECHGEEFAPQNMIEWTGRYAWINLDRPEQSAALTAHLATQHGGRGIAAVKNGKRSLAASDAEFVFRDRNDADFRAIESAINEGHAIMQATPEADRAGFAGARAEP